MRKRIQKLAMGKFEYEEPVLALSTDKIEIEVLEGQDYTGDFVITSGNHKAVKGIVYSSNPHMECLTPQFKGEEVRIRFQFHSEGFVEGDIQKGDFYIICNQGEYNLSFAASISRLYPKTSIGIVRNLHDFARLAQTDFAEAYKLFSSPSFGNLIREKELRERLFYEGLRDTHSMMELEEYLIAIKKKTAIHFSLEKNEIEMHHIHDDVSEILSIKKDQWGYIELEVSSDADFLIPDKQQLTTEDFIGSVCQMNYRIDASKLHAGKNYGRLVFTNAYQTETMEIMVYQTPGILAREHSKERREQQSAQVKLTKLYLDYRFKRIGGALWASESIGILNHLIAMKAPHWEWYELMRAQAFLVSGQKQEAEWILEEYRRGTVDKTSSVYGYYLYLCTLIEREASYVNRIAKQAEEIYRMQDENDVLFWTLLFLKDDYCRNPSLRLRAIEQRVLSGRPSPYFYMEAYYIYTQNPYLLSRLGDFEIQVLHWAGKYGALSQELSLSVLSLSGSIKTYQPVFFKILCMIYEKENTTQMLSAICSYLVRCQRFSPEYHTWYERGIELDLRIAGLNEAYLMSMDRQNVKKMPKLVQLYFQYDTVLPYKQKAALLVNIIASKEQEPAMYQNYRRILEDFALEQIREGHMDDNLAVIYSEMLERGMIQKEMVPSLAKIIYTHKLTVSGNMVRAYIIHEELGQVQIVPVIRNTAYFQLYTKNYVIILEDAFGKKYAGGISYQLERLLNPGTYLRKCLGYAPDEAVFLLHYFAARNKSTMFMPDDCEYLINLVKSDKLRGRYRATLYPELIRFLERMDEKELLAEHLEKISLRDCSRSNRIYLMEKLIENYCFARAYRSIEKYGAVQLSASSLMTLCTYEIMSCDGEEEEFLINLSSYVFLQGKYNETLLAYLAKYYGGTTKSMKKLWQACLAFEIDTFDLEERLLVQMLYTSEYVDGIEEVYDSYVAHDGAMLVREAYMYYYAYMYLVRKAVVPEQIFAELMQQIYEKHEVPDVGRLALLAYFAEENAWTPEKISVAEELLEDYVHRKMYFAFYQDFPDEIRYRYQFYDKVFVEYRTRPQNRVVIHYRMESEQGDSRFVAEEMTEVLEGIFVKAFTLFFDEAVEYYIMESDGAHSKATESDRIMNHSVCEDTGRSRYEMLNAMRFEQTLDETTKLQELMWRYDRHGRMNEKLFRMI